MTTKKKKKSGNRSGKRKKSGSRKSQKKSEQMKSRDTDEDEDEEDEDSDDRNADKEDQDVADDAEELYNLVHENLCKGMQQEEFEEIVGDLAGPIAFIELKQLYNQALDRKMDPMHNINVSDYKKILHKESGE